jgi:hypothetical protein
MSMEWVAGLVAGMGWGLVIGFALGVRWLRQFIAELGGDKKG